MESEEEAEIDIGLLYKEGEGEGEGGTLFAEAGPEEEGMIPVERVVVRGVVSGGGLNSVSSQGCTHTDII